MQTHHVTMNIAVDIMIPGMSPARNSCPTERFTIEAMSRNTIEGGMIGPTVEAQAITAAANNQYFETSMRALREHIAVGMKFHGLSLQTVRGGLDHVLDEHAAIHDAIRRGDAEAARAAMASHVGGSRDRLFEGRLLDLSSPR